MVFRHDCPLAPEEALKYSMGPHSQGRIGRHRSFVGHALRLGARRVPHALEFHFNESRAKALALTRRSYRSLRL